MFMVASNELKRMFYSPMAWIILAILQAILAFIFLYTLDQYINVLQPALAGQDNAPGLTDIVIASLYLWAGVIMLAVMPLLTMRLLAEERMNKTLVLLKSAPISSTQIVLGKYLGLMIFILIIIFMISLMPFSLALGANLDWGKFSAAVLGLVLLLASFAAAGLFLSSLTKQPIIAAMSTFGLLLFLVVIYISGSSANSASSLFVYLSHFGHFSAFLEGIFNTTDLIYYLLFIVGFLVLTIHKLDSDRLQG
ncbi:ABC transporter permease subunit [Thiofilum flexile]|uniref:ABC transporter permease subunit n=1 Tax=Thiofilum flexile TaxID=125627 RepID=UPI00038015B0|nr:ABC transporter permease subunit [Thiofilum flexile]